MKGRIVLDGQRSTTKYLKWKLAYSKISDILQDRTKQFNIHDFSHIALGQARCLEFFGQPRVKTPGSLTKGS